ncbi:MAG: MFS transporter [Steroidobacteraceae bacterium]
MPSDADPKLEELLDKAPFVGLPLLVSVLTALAVVFDGFDIQAIAFVAPSLMQEWGIDRAGLAPVLAAGLIGMALGALLVGNLGDRLGRRRALIGCLVLIAVASWASAFAENATQMTGLRLLTGVGLGGVLPNATALIVEFSPRRVRNLVVAVTIVGVPIGGMVGSMAAATVIPVLGWQAVFLIGAVLPAMLAAAMWIWLPESPRFLATRPARRAELQRLVAALSPGATVGQGVDPVVETGAPGVRALLVPDYRRETLLIWTIFVTNIFSVYCFFNWTPTILAGQGLDLGTALRGAMTFNLGGVVGSIFGAWIMNRLGSRPVLLTLGLVGALSTVSIGLALDMASGELRLMYAAIALAGACISGIQVQMYTVASLAYPTAIRSTGVGWATGMARLGGIASSYAGPLFLAFGSGTLPFFSGVAIVLLITWVAMVLLRSHLPAEA